NCNGMDLPAVIRELLLTSGSLVIPGLGRFYVTYRSAEMDKNRSVLSPPQQTVHFDEQMVSDDGKLAVTLQERYGLTESAAVQSVSDYAALLKKGLSEQATAIIEGIGKLESTEKGLSWQCFTLDHPLTSVLPSIEIPRATEKEPDAAKKHVPEPAPAAATVRPSGRRRLWIPVAIVAAVAAIGATLYFTGTAQAILHEIAARRNGNTASSENGRIVFGRPPSGKDSLQESVSSRPDERTSEENASALNEPERETETVLPGQPQPESPATGESGAPASEGPYHIIAGSFKVSGNAYKYKSQLEKKGFHPVILPEVNTYHMVSVGAYPSLGKARQAMHEFRARLGTQIWIMKI
ncbi:MAG: SPOR domain-containing protein, partial [Bacteroidales bacterium]|nr:SPOR domain-containing protein [Bacteroidales bacterium]